MFDKQALVNKTESLDKAVLWHYHLGHPGKNVTRLLGINILEKKCKVCELAKSYCQLFNKLASYVQEPLQRVYSNFVGPIVPEA